MESNSTVGMELTASARKTAAMMIRMTESARKLAIDGEIQSFFKTEAVFLNWISFWRGFPSPYYDGNGHTFHFLLRYCHSLYRPGPKAVLKVRPSFVCSLPSFLSFLLKKMYFDVEIIKIKQN